MTSIADMYNENPQFEWDRLERCAYNRLEFIAFIHHIRSVLPPTGLVLDAGAGPGRYTIELCRLGYEVVLVDVAQGCVEEAKKRIAREPQEVKARLREAVVADVRDLTQFGDGTFDSVLCLDPLSNLAEDQERRKALAELVRVAKIGAPVILAVRGYVDVIRTLLRVDSGSLLDDTLEKLKTTGNCTVRGLPHHFFRADELKALAESHGLETVLMAGGEGMSSGMPEATEAIVDDKEKWQRWQELAVEMSTDATVVDMSGHMLYVGRKVSG